MDTQAFENKEQIFNLLPPTNPTVRDEEILVALLNMGGPKTNADVRAFQMKLFNDRRLIRFPGPAWLQRFFAWLLITLRGKGAEERYMLMGGGSPIYKSTEAQVKNLKNELTLRGRKIDVTYSFNYTPPFPEDTIAEAKKAGKKYILPVSLYPHYSTATTGSNLYYLKEAAQRLYPELKFLTAPAYYLHNAYIEAFVNRVGESLRPGESLDDFYLIFSAHGLPSYFLLEGDPYAFQINQTVAKILNQLNRSDRWIIAYQSAVGPIQWLKPSTEKVLEALALRGLKKVLIIPVAFVSDHIETTCEIDMEYRAMAEKWGITDYRMSKALESHPEFIKALADTVEESLQQPLQNKSHPEPFIKGAAHVHG